MISQQYLNIFSCSDLLPLLIIQNIIVFIILFLFLAIWCLIKDVIEKPPCTLFNRSITVHDILAWHLRKWYWSYSKNFSGYSGIRVCEHLLLILKAAASLLFHPNSLLLDLGGCGHLFCLWLFLSGCKVKHLQWPPTLIMSLSWTHRVQQLCPSTSLGWNLPADLRIVLLITHFHGLQLDCPHLARSEDKRRQRAKDL